MDEVHACGKSLRAGTRQECVICTPALKSEPEYQARLKWARDVVSKVIIPPADSPDSGEVKP
jgi:hypothetical protein